MIMKKNYRKPNIKRIDLKMECIMAAGSIEPGEGYGDGDANAKRQSFIFDDGNIIDDRSTSYSEAESYSHADL